MIPIILIVPGCVGQKENNTDMPKASSSKVTFMTLDPGHFHAALVHKDSYATVDSNVYVFAPEGPELESHMQLLQQYNGRSYQPTNWDIHVYSGADFFQQMLDQTPGNVVVLSGNNARKTEYIAKAIGAGIHVLADKPMAINPEGFELLQQTMEMAQDQGLLLYDIMTERYEITTILQKELSQIPELFGEIQKGSLTDPAITKESVHHFFKYVSGNPLKRPPWFFDVSQQGEGIADVATHLIDLIFWECFPEDPIDYQKDIEVLKATRSPTMLSLDQFARVTTLEEFPPFLAKDLNDENQLAVYSNGEIFFTVRGIHGKISVIWNYEAPEGGKDTHYSIMKGSQVNLVIQQGAEQNYEPTLYVQPNIDDIPTVEFQLAQALENLSSKYAGLGYKQNENGWEVVIPDEFKIGHEAHFAEVTEAFLNHMQNGKIPEWELANMKAKYFVTSEAYKLSRE